jgi:anti-sigma factor RsiW
MNAHSGMNAHFDSNDSAMEPLHTDTNTEDRFELLSAYMDGEVTAEERRQVELWLEQDPQFKQMHQRLLMLQNGFQSMSAPVATQSVEQTIEQVFEKVDRRSRWRVIVGGSLAAAAALVAAVVGVTQMNNAPTMQMATKSPAVTVEAEDQGTMTPEGMLLVSLDESVIQPQSKTAVVNEPPVNMGGKDAVDARNN